MKSQLETAQPGREQTPGSKNLRREGKCVLRSDPMEGGSSPEIGSRSDNSGLCQAGTWGGSGPQRGQHDRGPTFGTGRDHAVWVVVASWIRRRWESPPALRAGRLSHRKTRGVMFLDRKGGHV